MFVATAFLPNRHNPFEDLALRWRRCEYLIGHNRRPSPTLDDAYTHDAWLFLNELCRCRDDKDRERQTQRHPAISAAHELFTQAESLKRAELEARLLARQSDETIARKCHLTPAVVAAYHQLFFAVRPHLQAEFYILSEAIGPKVFGKLTTQDREILLKLFGYCMGGLLVDRLLDYFANPPHCPADLTQLDDRALERLQDKLPLQAMLLSVTMPANASSAARLPELRRILAQAGILGKTATNDANSPSFAVQAALDFRAWMPEPKASAAADSRMPASQESGMASIRTGQLVCPERTSIAPRPSRQKAIPA